MILINNISRVQIYCIVHNLLCFEIKTQKMKGISTKLIIIYYFMQVHRTVETLLCIFKF